MVFVYIKETSPQNKDGTSYGWNSFSSLHMVFKKISVLKEWFHEVWGDKTSAVEEKETMGT